MTSALLVPKVFRERLFSNLNNHTTLGSLHAQTKPHRLISGVHIQTWQGFCHTVQQTSIEAGMVELEIEPSAVMGLLPSKNIRARNEGLFQKQAFVQLTLNTTV